MLSLPFREYLSDMTDEDLVRRAVGGDQAALLLLYERHRRAVFQVAYRLTGSHEDAVDIAHDCFMTLIREPGRFDPTRASLRTYLLAITRNLSVSHHRRTRRQTNLDAVDEAEQGRAPHDPQTQAIRRDLARHVRSAVLALPAMQREAIVLVEYEGLTIAEAAAVVGADLGAVSARLHRARAALRQKLSTLLRHSAGASHRKLERHHE